MIPTLDQLNHSPESQYGEFRLLPIEEFNGTLYAIEYRTTTPNGYERMDAYDLTAIDSIERETSRAARYNSEGQPTDDGPCVVVFWPDEGHTSIVTRDGRCNRWITTWAVALSKDPQLKEQLMDELEQSIDAGGHLSL